MPRKSAKASFDLTRHIQGAAAIDIGSRMHMAAVSPEAAKDPIRSFDTFTSDPHALAEWFKACKVTSVAMEYTGVYWIPVYEILEQHGFDVILVNARYAKNVPGRKTDVSDAGWLYLAVVIGLFSRRVIGWAASDRMKKDLAIRALDMAVRLRNPPPDCIFHSDRDSQYCSHDFQKRLTEYKMTPSMSEKGNCYDNAVVETFFKSVKAEMLWRQSWPTRRQATTAIFQYINGFYNPRRGHSYLGNISSLAFEAKAAEKRSHTGTKPLQVQVGMALSTRAGRPWAKALGRHAQQILPVFL
ncbi:Mobile element protein [Acetobacter tropicalis]|uniref:Mobile element protein n=1 Tax=Acetobacter tropicalis TaxID=104102 RepID=A0A094YHK9_9PROT|nr:Mobile element protein [Acetobacter tropicalis]